ncbi:Uma2 family endonuclease [Candidatus Poribacteria bacterium]|nr:Uma2 family endonuclease [Candidatus Poribacteria bacterium]
MVDYGEKKNLTYAPTDILYPEDDGKPMAAGDLHRSQLIRTLHVIEAYYASDPMVYVSGDLFIYYEEGVPSKSISPDVLVSFGVGMKQRRTYKVWEEGKTPEFVMEFSSKNTFEKDLTEKIEIYESLSIQNYFLYDAEDLYLPSQLMGYELIDGNYVDLPCNENGIHASSIGLAFQVLDDGLGIYNPSTGELLQTPVEREAKRADSAEAEVAQLREQVARMQSQS